MITASLVNIHYHTWFWIYFLVIGTFKIYFLSNFQMYNTVLLIVVTIPCITFVLLILIIGSTFWPLSSCSFYLLFLLLFWVNPPRVPTESLGKFTGAFSHWCILNSNYETSKYSPLFSLAFFLAFYCLIHCSLWIY